MRFDRALRDVTRVLERLNIEVTPMKQGEHLTGLQVEGGRRVLPLDKNEYVPGVQSASSSDKDVYLPISEWAALGCIEKKGEYICRQVLKRDFVIEDFLTPSKLYRHQQIAVKRLEFRAKNIEEQLKALSESK